MAMTDAEFHDAIEMAAERGARKALESIGLHDEDAGRDVRELRSLLESWREARKSVIQTIAKIVTTALLGALALGTYQWFNGK